MAIPIRDHLLVPYSANVNARLVASGVGIYQIPAARVAEYSEVHWAYVAAQEQLMAAREAGLFSESMTARRDAAKRALLACGRSIYMTVRGNLEISEADKILLGVRLRKRQARILQPVVRPGIEVLSVVGRTVKVRVHDSDSVLRLGKPAGTIAARVYSFVGAQPPAEASNWRLEGATTRAKFDVTFPSELAGGTSIWLCAAWINPRHEAGPFSAAIHTMLQGGGTITAAAFIKVAA